MQPTLVVDPCGPQEQQVGLLAGGRLQALEPSSLAMPGMRSMGTGMPIHAMPVPLSLASAAPGPQLACHHAGLELLRTEDVGDDGPHRRVLRRGVLVEHEQRHPHRLVVVPAHVLQEADVDRALPRAVVRAAEQGEPSRPTEEQQRHAEHDSFHGWCHHGRPGSPSSPPPPSREAVGRRRLVHLGPHRHGHPERMPPKATFSPPSHDPRLRAPFSVTLLRHRPDRLQPVRTSRFATTGDAVGHAALNIPKLGVSMTEGTLVEWLVADGATVDAGDVIYRLETDKVENDVEAPVAGVVPHHR